MKKLFRYLSFRFWPTRKNQNELIKSALSNKGDEELKYHGSMLEKRVNLFLADCQNNHQHNKAFRVHRNKWKQYCFAENNKKGSLVKLNTLAFEQEVAKMIRKQMSNVHLQKSN